MSKVERAPIVYGRTYEVDFRFLVVPEDFQVPNQAGFQLKNQDWLESHINATMLLAEQLPGQPRWSVFKNRTHCIFGVTCMAADVSDEKVHDFKGRAIYVFLGYVFRLAEVQPIPRELEAFKDLYVHYVLAVWNEKAYAARSKAPAFAAYQSYEVNADDLAEPESEVIKGLNYDKNKIFLWSDLPDFQEKLWQAAYKCPQPVSLCLGLPNETSALKGVFVNGTALDLPPVKVLDREQQSQDKIVLDRLEVQWREADSVLRQDVESQETPKYERSEREKPNRDVDSPLDQGLKNPAIQPEDDYLANPFGGVVEGMKGALKDFFDPRSRSEQRPQIRSTSSNEDRGSSENDRGILPLPPTSSQSKRRTEKKPLPSQNQPTDPEKGFELGFKPKEAKEGEDNDPDSKDKWF